MLFISFLISKLIFILSSLTYLDCFDWYAWLQLAITLVAHASIMSLLLDYFSPLHSYLLQYITGGNSALTVCVVCMVYVTHHTNVRIVFLHRPRAEKCNWQTGPVCGSKWPWVWEDDNGETEGQFQILFSVWRGLLRLLPVQACNGTTPAYVAHIASYPFK